MRGLAIVCLGLAACKGQPARLIGGNSDTLVVNDRRPVKLAVRVLDAAGRSLDSTAVSYRWVSGVRIPLSPDGFATCEQTGDATVRASLGSLATDIVVRCRPIRDVHSSMMMNLVIGGPPQELPFEVVGTDGRPVTLLSGHVSIKDSTIATLEGQRIRGRAPGCTEVTMRVGGRLGFASVHVYEPASTPENIRPGQHVAIPVRLGRGEMRRWRVPASPELFFIAMLRNHEEQPIPQLAIVGANCGRGLDVQSFFCLARQGASVIAYYPQQVDAAQELRGTLAIWRQEKP